MQAPIKNGENIRKPEDQKQKRENQKRDEEGKEEEEKVKGLNYLAAAFSVRPIASCGACPQCQATPISETRYGSGGRHKVKGSI